MNDVSQIDETQTYSPAYRRCNMCVHKLQFCVVDGGLVRFDRALILPDLRLLGIDLLLGDHTFVKKKRVTLEIDLYVVELRLVFGELAFCLLKHHLVGTRIDFDECIALMDELALGEVHFHDRAVNAAADGYRIESVDRAQTDEVNGKVALLRRGDNHGYDHASAPGAPLSLPSGACGGLPAGFARRARCSEIPDSDGDDAKNNYPEPPAALDGR